jgi:hypothetical protein
MIIKEPVQSLPHGGEISSTITSKPPTPDQHVDFSLAQLNRDTSQPLPSAITMAAHPLGTGRARPGWRSRERRIGHEVPILHRRRGKKKPRRDGGQQPEGREERPAGRGGGRILPASAQLDPPWAVDLSRPIVINRLAGRLHENFALSAKLTGELQRGLLLNIHNNLMVSLDYWRAIARIVAAVTPFPETRQAVIAALRELDAVPGPAGLPLIEAADD